MDPFEPGEQLRRIRESWNVSQNHLAELSGIGQDVISRVERGADARWTTLKRLFGALGCEIVIREEEYGEDDLEDLVRHGIQRRKDRMEAGRERRW
jgi:transcriptional regulator with XRE-family HTH domain